MVKTNLPWTESPFFEELLQAQTKLSAKEKEEAREFHQSGFLQLSQLLDESLIDQAQQEVQRRYEVANTSQHERILDHWKDGEAVRKIAAHPVIMSKLSMLYQRRPIPFQTLNFKYGSQQHPHSDSIHFQSLPPRFMCGVWVALEDTDDTNGTLVYYPGSHHWPVYDYSVLVEELQTAAHSAQPSFYPEHYEPFMQKVVAESGIAPVTLQAKKGDVIIWAANLVHGGLPIREEGRTRWSQVTHYFFDNCLYYNPRYTNTLAGEWCISSIIDISTGQREWGSYNGRPVKRKKADGPRYLISRYAPKDWRDLGLLFKKAIHKFSGK